MANVGTAYINIMPSTKGISGSLSQAIGGEATSAGKTAGLNIVGAIKGAIVASGIAAVLKTALDAGGDLQQSFGGLDTIYGDASESMKEMAYNAAQAGISANDYAEQAVSFGASLKQAFGGDTVAAAKAADTAIMDMADNAAKMGTDMGSIQMAYQGFAKQNYTMLDNLKLGYGGTKTEMERLLKDAQALTGVEYNIDNLGDVYEAIHVVQKELGLTGVAAQEGAETFKGSLSAMKASATNLLANLTLGEDVKEPLMSLIENVKNFLVNNLFPMIGNILKQLPGLIGEALLWAFNNIPNLVDSAITFINNLANGISEGSGAFKEKLVEIGHAAIEMFKTIDWAGLGKAIINLIWEGLQAIGPVLWDGLKWIGQTAWDWFKSVDWKQLGLDTITLIWRGLQALGSWIWEKLKSIGRLAVEKFKEIDWLQLGKDVITFIWNGLGAIGSWIWSRLKYLGTVAVNKFKEIDWLQLGKDVITFIWNGLGEIGNWIWEKLQSIGDEAVEKFKEIDWVQLGKDIIGFIWSGISEVGSDIWEGLGWIGQKALGWLCGDEAGSGLDWEGGGSNIAGDIAYGIDSNGYLVSNAMSGVASDTWNTMANNDWAGLGASISSGISSGISGAAATAVAPIIEVKNRVMNTARKLFKINSPSKLMRDEIGIAIPEGIAEGIDKNVDMVTDSIQKLTDLSVSDINTDFSRSLNLDTSGSGPAAPASPITINVYPSAGMDERQLADLVQQRLTFEQRQRQAAWGTA